MWPNVSMKYLQCCQLSPWCLSSVDKCIVLLDVSMECDWRCQMCCWSDSSVDKCVDGGCVVLPNVQMEF